MTKSVAASLGFVIPYGAIFETPKPDGPAAPAGIEAGDVVTTINGIPLSKSRNFEGVIARSGRWNNLAGRRVAPYTCDLGTRQHSIDATVTTKGPNGTVYDLVTPAAIENADIVVETRPAPIKFDNGTVWARNAILVVPPVRRYFARASPPTGS